MVSASGRCQWQVLVEVYSALTQQQGTVRHSQQQVDQTLDFNNVMSKPGVGLELLRCWRWLSWIRLRWCNCNELWYWVKCQLITCGHSKFLKSCSVLPLICSGKNVYYIRRSVFIELLILHNDKRVYILRIIFCKSHFIILRRMVRHMVRCLLSLTSW